MSSEKGPEQSAGMSFYLSGAGMELNRLERKTGGVPKAGVMISHGMGEHIARYGLIADLLAGGACAVAGVDLPGHGRSPGDRGDVGTWEAVETIFDESVARLRAEVGEEGRLGLVAHSMGALLALRYLEVRPEIFSFAWLSSPLLRPSDMQPGVVRVGARLLAKVMPGRRFDSGVRPSMCRVIPEGEERDPLIHSRITAGWGVELWNLEKEIYANLGRLNPDLQLLITQGDADVICPMEHARALFERIDLRDKEWVLLEGELHEPLFGAQSAKVLALVWEWMELRGLLGKT
jgi:lysophospholipase